MQHLQRCTSSFLFLPRKTVIHLTSRSFTTCLKQFPSRSFGFHSQKNNNEWKRFYSTSTNKKESNEFTMEDETKTKEKTQQDEEEEIRPPKRPRRLFWISLGAGVAVVVVMKYSNPNEPEEPQLPLKERLSFGRKVAIFGSLLAIFIGFNIAIIPFFFSSLGRFGKIPFVTTSPIQLKTMFELLPTKTLISGKEGKPIFVDLGSGDGRVVIEAAKKGFHGVGYEINPWLVWFAQRKARQEGVSDRCQFIFGDFWAADLSHSSVVMIYGLESVMPRLQAKIDNEVQPGSFIVSNSFRIPRWKPLNMKHDIWIYLKKSQSTQKIEEEKEKEKQQKNESSSISSSDTSN